MAIGTPPKGTQSELEELEAHASEHLEETGLTELDAVEPVEEDELERLNPAIIKRLSFVAGFGVLAAAVMAGGVFEGVTPRIWAALAGWLGIAIAVSAAKIKKPLWMALVIVGGVFSVGLLLTLPAGLDAVFGLRAELKEAAKLGNTRTPPIEFAPGWRAILGWLMAGLGFACAWVAIEVRKPALGIMIPLPVVMITAISVRDEDQVWSGILSLVFFIVALGLLSGAQLGEDGSTPSLAFEIRRAIRALPLIAAITAVLALLAQTNFLFPPPLYDPSNEPQRPKTAAPSEVKDRALFYVKSSITGPWKMGNLDVYETSDGTWRLPPFAQSKLAPVKRSGVVDAELQPGIKAEFEIADLGGAVLPGLPNTVGILASGPKLAYDGRTGNIRLHQGTIKPGLKYTVVAATVPKVEELQQVSQPVEDLECTPGIRCEEYLEIQDPPPGVQRLLNQAPQTSAWDRMDFLRMTLLKTVISKGAGNPVPTPPSKVEDMLFGTKEGSPFEIVAGQAMLARWAGVPARIAYGFDGGEKNGDLLEVRPKHGASYLEVYIPGYKWLPVIGTPLQAATSVDTDQQQFNPNVQASNDVSVKLLVPIALDPRSLLFEQIQRVLLIVVPIVLLILGLYYAYPAWKKWRLRARRAAWALEHGPQARIAVAYAHWRDVATDFGYEFNWDTPLMFLDRVVEDEEHSELAWLVTRALWGDLRDDVTDEDATVAEELSRSLRKRLSQGHTWTLRSIAAVSRLSLRKPYAPDIEAAVARKEGEDEKAAA